MPSLKSQLFFFALRNRNLFKLSLKRETWDENTSIPAFRETCEAGAKKAGPLPAGIEVLSVAIPALPEGLSAEWIQPSAPVQPADAPVIFYTMGGGYVSGSCSDHRARIAKVAAATGMRLLSYEYRLAPEHPYPAAIEDSLAAYGWLLEQGVSPRKVVIMGESAGGGLCLALLQALRDQGMPLPAAAMALSPWTDLKLTGASYRTKVRACMSPIGMSQVCSGYYAGTSDPTLPWISPLYGDLSGLPPTLIYTGDDETMRDDTIAYGEKACAAGAPVTWKIWPGMGHCFPLFAPLFPEATQAMEEITHFIQAHVAAG